MTIWVRGWDADDGAKELALDHPRVLDPKTQPDEESAGTVLRSADGDADMVETP